MKRKSPPNPTLQVLNFQVRKLTRRRKLREPSQELKRLVTLGQDDLVLWEPPEGYPRIGRVLGRIVTIGGVACPPAQRHYAVLVMSMDLTHAYIREVPEEEIIAAAPASQTVLALLACTTPLAPEAVSRAYHQGALSGRYLATVIAHLGERPLGQA